MSVIKITDLNINWSNKDYLWKKDLSFKVEEGDVALITGPSGCGKSCVLNAMLHLIPGYKVKGKIEVLQDYAFLFTANALEEKQTLAYNMEKYYAIFYNSSCVDELKFYVSLNEKINWNDIVSTFSFGTKRRIALYRTLFAPVQLYLLDEPTTGFDAENVGKIKKLILQLQLHKKTFLIVTHESGLADIATRIVFLSETYAEITKTESIGFIKLKSTDLNKGLNYINALKIDACLAFKYGHSENVIFKINNKNDWELIINHFNISSEFKYWKNKNEDLLETVNFFSNPEINNTK